MESQFVEFRDGDVITGRVTFEGLKLSGKEVSALAELIERISDTSSESIREHLVSEIDLVLYPIE